MEPIESIEFAGARVSIVREEQVQRHLSLESAMEDLRDAFRAYGQQQAVNSARARIIRPNRS